MSADRGYLLTKFYRWLSPTYDFLLTRLRVESVSESFLCADFFLLGTCPRF